MCISEQAVTRRCSHLFAEIRQRQEYIPQAVHGAPLSARVVVSVQACRGANLSRRQQQPRESLPQRRAGEVARAVDMARPQPPEQGGAVGDEGGRVEGVRDAEVGAEGAVVWAGEDLCCVPEISRDHPRSPEIPDPRTMQTP